MRFHNILVLLNFLLHFTIRLGQAYIHTYIETHIHNAFTIELELDRVIAQSYPLGEAETNKEGNLFMLCRTGCQTPSTWLVFPQVSDVFLIDHSPGHEMRVNGALVIGVKGGVLGSL